MRFVNVDGTVVTPEQVVGPNQAGRKVVILGQTSRPMVALRWAQGADSVVFSPSLQVSKCYYGSPDTGHLTEMRSK